MLDKLLGAAKSVVGAVGHFITSVTSASGFMGIVKLGVLVGVTAGVAYGVAKAVGFFKKKSDEAEKMDEDVEALLYTGLRLSPEDFKDSRMHPDMKMIEDFNNTIDDHIKEEFMTPTKENARFIKQLKEAKKKCEREKLKKVPLLNFSLTDLLTRSKSFEYVTEFRDYNPDDGNFTTGGLMD